jgi:hypothetical protein
LKDEASIFLSSFLGTFDVKYSLGLVKGYQFGITLVKITRGKKTKKKKIIRELEVQY